MDNVSRVYAARFHEAVSLATQGDIEGCLDICWDLRLQPDLSLYRRAHVNWLIAREVDVQYHQDAAKYAQECMDLVEIVKAEGFCTNPKYLDSLSREAKRIKTRIEDQLRKNRGEPKPVEELERGVPFELDLGSKLVQNLRAEFGESSLGGMTVDERQPIFIEGMYGKAPFPGSTGQRAEEIETETNFIDGARETMGETEEVRIGIINKMDALHIGEGYDSPLRSTNDIPATPAAAADKIPDSGIGMSVETRKGGFT